MKPAKCGNPAKTIARFGGICQKQPDARHAGTGSKIRYIPEYNSGNFLAYGLFITCVKDCHNRLTNIEGIIYCRIDHF